MHVHVNPSPDGRGWREAPGEGHHMKSNLSSPDLKDLARNMPRQLTKAERRAWNLLRDRRILGLKFRRQVAIDRYIADFYCEKLRLIIELDGPVHDLPERVEKDRERERRLKELGFQILHITNETLFNHPDSLFESIFSILTPSPGASRHPLP